MKPKNKINNISIQIELECTDILKILFTILRSYMVNYVRLLTLITITL